MWTVTIKRPDIANIVRSTAKFWENPGVVHKKAVEKILPFVLRTANLGITYGGKDSGIEMLAYADSDHATCPDTRRSVSRGAVLLAGGAISWHSRTQEITASTSSELEYVTLAETLKYVRCPRQMEAFIMPTLESYSVTVMEDNQGGIKMANSKRTGHIDVKHHVVRNAVDEGKVTIVYVETGSQHADVLTKGLEKNTFLGNDSFSR